MAVMVACVMNHVMYIPVASYAILIFLSLHIVLSDSIATVSTYT